MRSGRLLALVAAFVATAGIMLGLHAWLGSRDTVTLAIGARTALLLAPRWLLGLALVPYLALVLTTSLVDFSRAQLALSVAVRALFVACVVVALARPALVERRQLVATVALVDVSDSVSDRQLDEARGRVEALREEARRLGPERAQLSLVAFAGRPFVIPLPPDGELLPAAASWRPRTAGDTGDTSDLEAALRLAYGLYPPGSIRRALLFSDGNQTRGDLLAEADSARARGVRLDVEPFAMQHDDEVLVRELRLPGPARDGSSSVRIGSPFTLTAEVYASRPTAATLTLTRAGATPMREERRAVELAAGRNVVTFHAEVDEPGAVTYALAASDFPPDFHDRWSSNNRALASLEVRGKPRVLYVEGEPSSATYLASALTRDNFDVSVRSSYGLPSNPAELARFDLVIVSDVPAAAFGAEQQAAVETYVKEMGGGFVMTGGEASFGSGGFGGTRIERLLPVRFDVEKKREEPSLALLLCIDRSGSMQGDKLELAKEAAKQSAELLGGEDLIGVVAFDAQAQPLVRLQRAANRARILSDMSRLTAGGGTNILAPLQEAFQELAPAKARVKHVILLTDGQAEYEGIAELVDQMVEARITVSAVGVGTGADKTLLTMIAERGGGRFYFTQDAENVPKIFTKETTEVARSSLVEQAVRAKVVKRAELLDGVPVDGAPPLRGYAPTQPKPLSEVILATDTTGEPLLVRWRVGLGQAAVWTSDVKNRWAIDWVRWPGYGKLFAQLARSTMRHRAATGGEAGYPLTTEVDPPHVHAVIDAVSEGDRFVNGLETTLEVTPATEAAGRPTRSVPLTQTAAGRYEGDFTLDRYGSYLLRARHRRDGRIVGESTGAVSVPYPLEYLALPPDTALLERAAATTGGRVSPTARAAFDAGTEFVAWHRERWSLPLWAAIALLALDVLCRRVRLLGYRRIV